MKLSLEQYGESGWAFAITEQDALDGQLITKRYRTNPSGDGLWVYRESPSSWYPDGSPVMEWHQVRGTSQFWLPANRKRAYDKIRYEWSRRSS